MCPVVSRRQDQYQLKADAILDQAAPVQNTWYTVLNSLSNVRIINVLCRIQTAVETLEARITIDGNVLTGQQINAVVNTQYFIASAGPIAQGLYFIADDNTFFRKAFFLEGRIVKIEARKITALGAGNLQCYVKYARR